MNGRFLTAALLIAFFVAPVTFAVDFGGSLENDTGVSKAVTDTSGSVDQTDTLSAWFQLPFGASALFFAQGSYQFTLDRPYLFDVDKAYLEAVATDIPNGPVKLTFDLGRAQMSDMSGYVMNTRADGARLTFGYPRAQLSVNLGYTGLLLKPNSTVVMSQVDATAAGTSSVILGSPRIVGDFELLLPDAFARQALGFALLFQQDMRSQFSLVSAGTETLEPTSGGALNTQYAGLALSGPVTSQLYYGAYGFLNTGTTLSYIPDSSSSTGYSYQYVPILAYMAGARMSYFFPGATESRLQIRGAFSSGDPDATAYYEGNTGSLSTTFVPISQSQFALIFSPQLGNSANAEVNFSLKPLAGLGVDALKSLRVEAKSVAYFRTAFSPSTGAGAPVSEAGLLPGSTSPYLGTEVDGTIGVKPLSDLSVVFSGGAFFPFVNATSPNRGAFPAGTTPEYLVQLGVSLMF